MTAAFKRILLSCWSYIIAVSIAISWINYNQAIQTTNVEVSTILNRIFTIRGNTLVTHDTKPLNQFYNLSCRSSENALMHEKTRGVYIRAWEKARQTNFIKSDVRIRITRVRNEGLKKLVNLRQTIFLDYTYNDDTNGTRNTFAVDTLHSITLQKCGNRWVINKEWYLDPLKEDTLVPNVMPQKVKSLGIMPNHKGAMRPSSSTSKYDRQGAVSYAHEYSGVALTPAGKHYYNKAYRSYNGLGGDCTNFASQVLHEGGGVPMTGSWFTHRGSGSKAWVHTDSLAYFLMNSGFAERIARGNFIQVVTPSNQYSYGPIQSLSDGDLIGYEEKGDLVHFAVVTGRDSSGQLLVNSHTADRYRVPWDLGWDQKTIFWLFKIKY